MKKTIIKKTPKWSYKQHPTLNIASIVIEDGQFADLVYQLGEIGFTESEDKTECSLNFVIDLIENPYDIDPKNNDELEQMCGDILWEILEAQIAKETTENELL